jgi:hypothetical protein
MSIRRMGVLLAWAGSMAGMTTPALAATFTYPGAAPCDTTLQACVDAIAAGSIVELAQNAQIAEFVTIDKSLTVRNASGFAPQVEGLLFVATTADVTGQVSGLADGSVRGVMATGGGSLALTITANHLSAGDSQSAIEILDNYSTGPFGTLTAIITDNAIDQSSTGVCGDAIVVSVTAAQMATTITNNRITATNLNQCGGIDVVVGAGGGGSATMDRNIVQGTQFDLGIILRHFGANPGDTTSPLSGTVVNNLVVGQNGNTGAPAGIVVLADGNNAQLSAEVINNTVSDGRLGVLVSARTDLGATLAGRLENNIVARNSQADIGIDGVLPSFHNGFNMVSAVGGGFSPGPGTKVADPHFVSPTGAGGNYQLLPTSTAIDAGDPNALNPAFTADLAGNPRVVGVIDLGAYESNLSAPPPFPHRIPTIDPLALIAAALALAAIGATALRRRG